MVLLESMSGSGHRIIKIRPKLSEKLEILYFDPLGRFVCTSVCVCERK